MFDIATLNSSTFRDVRFYTTKDVNTGGQRLAKHSFINGGTKTVSSGLQDDSFTVEQRIQITSYSIVPIALRCCWRSYSINASVTG